MTEEPKEKQENAVEDLKRYFTIDPINLITFISALILAFLQALATRNWSPILATILSVLIVIFALLFIFRRQKKKAERLVITPPKGAAFRGLLPFEEADREKFYGREIEVGALYDMVKHDEFLFGVLTGGSGCGKTSLVRAGLIPKLQEAGYLPVYIQFYNKNPLELIKQAIKRTSRVEPKQEESLEIYLNRVASKTQKTLVLLCDQFEEFFILFKTKQSRESFIAFIKTCYGESRLPVKFLFALRGDFFYRICEFDSHIPEPLDKKRYDLKNFDEKQAEEVIERSVQGATIPFEPGLSALVAKDLATNNNVLPTELQIVCQRMQSERIFTIKKYKEAGGKENLVYGYLKEVVKASRDEEGVKLVLRALISEENTKLALSLNEISKRTQKNRKHVETILNSLISARIIRKIQEEDTRRYELMHEYLIDKINAITGKVADLAKRANFAFKQWLMKYDIDRKTRIPLGELWLIWRHSDLLRGNKEKELLTKSFRWEVAKYVGIAVFMFFAPVLVYYFASSPQFPRIDSFSPPGGLAGTVVTISGANFDEGFMESTLVEFGGVRADILEKTPSRIITKVPSNARSEKIRVREKGIFTKRSVSSEMSFIVDVVHPTKNEPKNYLQVRVAPSDIAFTPDGEKAYVTNSESNCLSVINIDLDRFEEIDVDHNPNNGMNRIPVGKHPVAIAISPDGKKAYVTNMDSDDISVVDLQTRKEIQRITLGQVPLQKYISSTVVEKTHPVVHQPIDITISFNGKKLYIINFNSKDLTIVDIETEKLEKIILGGGNPTSIAITPDDKKVYVTMINPPSIKVINLTNKKNIRTIGLEEDNLEKDSRIFQVISPDEMWVGQKIVYGVEKPNLAEMLSLPPNFGEKYPWSIAVSPNGNRAYVASGFRDRGALIIIDTVNEKVLATIPQAPVITDVAISSDGREVYLTLGEEIKVFDTSSYKLLSSIPIHAKTENIYLAPKQLGACVIAGGYIKFIDTQNRKVRAVSISSGKSQGWSWMAVNPDGSRGYVTDKQQNLVYIMDLTNDIKLHPIEVGSAPSCITITPDGKRAYVTNQNENNVSVIDLDKGKEKEIDIDEDESNGITRIPVGEAPRFLTFTPDGKYVYVLNKESISIIDVVTNSTLGSIPVKDVPSQIAISPHGKYGYVLTGKYNEGQNLIVFDLEDNKIVEYLKVCKLPTYIVINSEGTLAYVDCEKGIKVVNLLTNEVVSEIPGEQSFGSLGISPDGKRVYYVGLDESLAYTTIKVIDTANNKEIDTDNNTENGITPITSGCCGLLNPSIIFAPNGNRAYIIDKRGVSIIE